MSWMRQLGSTGLQVSAVGLGGGPLVSAPGHPELETPYERALATIQAAFDSPIRYVDMANGYGTDGEGEKRIREAIRRAGGLPEGFVVGTKIDEKDGDYSADRVRRSVEESLERLGMDFLPVCPLHDPEGHDFATMAAKGGAVEALVDLREQGVVGAIGLSAGDSHEMAKYLSLEVFDVLFSWGRWTLVDRSAAAIFAEARRQQMGVVNMSVYGHGILAHQEPSGPQGYVGRDVTPQPVLDAVEAMRAACARRGTDIATAALQFSLRSELVDMTLVGISRPERIGWTIEAAEAPLPDDLFAELESLLPAEEHWIDASPARS